MWEHFLSHTHWLSTYSPRVTQNYADCKRNSLSRNFMAGELNYIEMKILRFFRQWFTYDPFIASRVRWKPCSMSMNTHHYGILNETTPAVLPSIASLELKRFDHFWLGIDLRCRCSAANSATLSWPNPFNCEQTSQLFKTIGKFACIDKTWQHFPNYHFVKAKFIQLTNTTNFLMPQFIHSCILLSTCMELLSQIEIHFKAIEWTKFAFWRTLLASFKNGMRRKRSC